MAKQALTITLVDLTSAPVVGADVIVTREENTGAILDKDKGSTDVTGTVVINTNPTGPNQTHRAQAIQRGEEILNAFFIMPSLDENLENLI